ncbi:MAG: hypothetical protein P8106_09410 [Gammaproteobacteria bacterium]|jgi:hypothetical protein
MRYRPSNDQKDSSVLIALLGLLFFASPLMVWWVRGDSPWYLPYLLWALIIVLAGLIHSRRDADGP